MSNGKQPPPSLYFVDEASPEGLGITLEQYRQLIKEVRPTMSTKREPLLSNEALEFLMANHTPEQIRDILALYEWTRAKDAELIQQLVNALHWYVEEDDVREGDFSAEGGTNWDEENAPWIEGRNEAISILDAAAAAGFKPSEE